MGSIKTRTPSTLHPRRLRRNANPAVIHSPQAPPKQGRLHLKDMHGERVAHRTSVDRSDADGNGVSDLGGAGKRVRVRAGLQRQCDAPHLEGNDLLGAKAEGAAWVRRAENLAGDADATDLRGNSRVAAGKHGERFIAVAEVGVNREADDDIGGDPITAHGETPELGSAQIHGDLAEFHATRDVDALDGEGHLDARGHRGVADDAALDVEAAQRIDQQ